MPDDIAVEQLSPPVPAATGGEPQSHWRLLGHLENAAIGQRADDGSIAVRRGDPAGFLLYGPFWRLPAGFYRLSFRCECGRPRFTGQPVLGVEVINRLQMAWRDFTAAELRGSSGSFVFAVPAILGQEAQSAGPQFRFYHLGNADLRICAVDLVRLPDREQPSVAPSQWRLLGRLQKSLGGRRRADGGVTTAWLPRAGCLLYGGWPYLRLSQGIYRLRVRCRLRGSGAVSGPALGIEVVGQSRWRSQGRLRAALRPGAPRGILLAGREFTSAEVADGYATVDFTVPSELSVTAGANAPIEIRLFQRSNRALDVDSVDLLLLDDRAGHGTSETLPIPAAFAADALGRKKIVIIGNCQGDVIRDGFNRLDALSSRFDCRYYAVDLPPNLYEFAKRDLSKCDILLVQDIGDWDSFPLREDVPDTDSADTIFFPAIRFATLWPFDGWNGPGDATAASEVPNLTFPYHDGLLARLRREIPDREERFRAYRALDWPGIIDYRRLHAFEERRLLALDKKFGTAIGAFILDNFRKRQIFYTTVRPNREVYTLLMRYLLKRIGVVGEHALPQGIEMALRNPQVPVHPKVARDLGVKWADERTRYLDHGREITWERYIRSYIDHYG